jgi:hypothetical protein
LTVSSSNLIRLGGLADAVGGVLLIISNFLALFLVGYDLSEAATMGTYTVVTALVLISAILLLVGLVALYAGQSEAAGLLGLMGFLVSFAGTALVGHLSCEWLFREFVACTRLPIKRRNSYLTNGYVHGK